MPNDIDLSPEALLAHREKAEAATPGPWRNGFWTVAQGPETAPTRLADCSNVADAAHIAANSPHVVKAHIDEILRLRAELAATKCREGEGDAYVEQLCLERDDLEAQVARLEREADWLAQQFQNCPDEMEPEGEYWDICKMEDCAGVGKEDVAACWRRAARKAVEKKA